MLSCYNIITLSCLVNVILSYYHILLSWWYDILILMSWCHDVILSILSYCHVVMMSWCHVTPGYDVGVVHVPSADDPVSTMNWRELASWAVLSLALWPLLLQDSEYWSKELDNNVSSSDYVTSTGPPAINGGDEKLTLHCQLMSKMDMPNLAPIWVEQHEQSSIECGDLLVPCCQASSWLADLSYLGNTHTLAKLNAQPSGCLW